MPMNQNSILGETVDHDVRTEALIKPELIMEELDKTDFRILRKFYLSGPKPHDTSMYVQVVMKKELESDGTGLSVRAVGLRMKRLVGLGLLKESGANPKIYCPKEELKVFIRKLIAMYSASLGIDQI